jgi:hypothetical protein
MQPDEDGVETHLEDGKSADMDLASVAHASYAEINEDEDQHAASFSFDDPASGVVQVMKGYDESTVTTDSENEDDESVEVNVPQYGDSDIGWDAGGQDQDPDSEIEFVSEAMASMSFQAVSHSEIHTSPARGSSASVQVEYCAEARTYMHTPIPKRRSTQQRPARSALKSASVTPGSGHSSHTTYPRSVSFCDGRRDGKIHGLEDNVFQGHSVATAITARTSNGTSFVPSVRSKRIAEMLGNLEQPSV